jgi:hypothetical protein
VAAKEDGDTAVKAAIGHDAVNGRADRGETQAAGHDDHVRALYPPARGCLDRLHFVLAVQGCGRIVQQHRYPELFRIASDIGRKAGCFEIRKKDRTAFDDGDFDTEFHKRDGDFHAEKASPNHGSALSIASGSPDRVRIAFIVRGAPSVFKPTRTEF